MDQKRSLDSDVIFGVHPVLEKLAVDPEAVTEVLVAASLSGPTLEKIESAALRSRCPVRRMEAATLNALVKHAKHQGVAAKVAPFKYGSFRRLLEELESPDPRCVVFLDGLTDPRNFGSILRTSEAMGIADVVIAKDRAVGVTPTVIKTSAGAAHHVRIYRVSNLARSLVAVRGQGLWIAGMDPHGERVLHEVDLPLRLGVVLGAEGAGIRPLVRSKCDYGVSLPMQGRVGSMNVSVAWGMFAYEWMRQRTAQRVVDICQDR